MFKLFKRLKNSEGITIGNYLVAFLGGGAEII